VEKVMPRFTGLSKRSMGTSPGAHVRALAEMLHAMIDNLHEIPSERRVRLRTHLAMLIRAYPEHLLVNESALAQALAEEDGIPQED